MGLGDYALSIKMRDTMIKMAEDVVNRMRPADRYGVIQSVDVTNRKCSVLLTGDPVPITVNMGALFPISTGQTVRVAGAGGDKYLADIFAGFQATQVNSPYFRATSTSDASPTSTNHAFQIGSTSGDNLIADINEIMARSNGVASPLYLNNEGQGIEVGGGTGADDATDEVRVGRLTGLRTVLNYNQLRALLNNVASTLYLNYNGGDVSICANSTTKGIVSPGVMRAKQDTDTTNITNQSNTTGALGSPICGFSFVAPPSGIVAIECSAYVAVTTTNELGYVWAEIRTGSTVGSGSQTSGVGGVSTHGDGDNGPRIVQEAHNGTGNGMVGSGLTLVSGLTPGTTYNLSVWYRIGNVAAGNMDVNARRCILIPSM